VLHIDCEKVGTDIDGCGTYDVTIEEKISIEQYNLCKISCYLIFRAPNRKKAIEFATLLYKAGYNPGRYIYSKGKEKELLSKILSKI